MPKFLAFFAPAFAPVAAASLGRSFSSALAAALGEALAKAETIAKLPMFRDAYAKRRCIVPVDGFFEWRAIKGAAKQPYAIAMKDGSPIQMSGSVPSRSSLCRQMS